MYIDIDGVLLSKKQVKLVENAKSLIEFAIMNFDCYWLTTHCKGDCKNVWGYLSKYFDKETMELIKQIKPTLWDTLKTEAIDFSTEFFWLEDNPFQAELLILKEKNFLDRLITVNNNKKDELIRVKKLLENQLKNN